MKEPNGEVVNCTMLGSNARVISGDIRYLEKLKYKSDARYILVIEKVLEWVLLLFALS